MSVVSMPVLDRDCSVLLAMLVRRPRDYLPPGLMPIADRLAGDRLIVCEHGVWRPTADGIQLIERHNRRSG